MTATMTLETSADASTTDATETPAIRSAPGRRHAFVPTELGDLTLVADGDALVGIYFPEHRPAPPTTVFGELVDPVETDDPVLTEAAAQLVDYVAGRRGSFDVPTAATGSDRARRVWELIAAVPRGETTTYAALGRAVGIGPRAAGQFVARNPLSVVVPCHRVVASDGRLTGYAGGVDRKRWLLELEGTLSPGEAKVARAATAHGGGEAEPAADPGPEESAEGVSG